MNAVSIIEKKRDGQSLTPEEINFFIEGYTDGSIPDYQAAAWCMAVYLQGMTREETVELTLAMANSGDVLDLSDTLPYVVDKHSSGGVGDKTSLVVLPLVFACGVPVAKMSGRGLSFTGGTLDKLESITGYSPTLTMEQFLKQAAEVGIVLAGQSAELAPADGKLYALRDVTGTVPSKPLIASSIMSKKIAAGANGIVLDVKTGNGAFMETVEDARELAIIMAQIGKDAGRQVTSLISDMNQPLGKAVGNALEVVEAIDTMNGVGPADFIEHCIVVAGHMLRMAGKSHEADLSDIRPILEEKLRNGEALEAFKTLIKAQGGSTNQIDHPEELPRAGVIRDVKSPHTGYLSAIHARLVGITALTLGAGRYKKGALIDHEVGLICHHKVGDKVDEDTVLYTIHANNEDEATVAETMLINATEWSERPVERLPLFYDVIVSEDL